MNLSPVKHVSSLKKRGLSECRSASSISPGSLSHCIRDTFHNDGKSTVNPFVLPKGCARFCCLHSIGAVKEHLRCMQPRLRPIPSIGPFSIIATFGA